MPNISMIYRNTADGSRLLSELKARGLVNGAEVQARRPDNRDIWISINSRKNGTDSWPESFSKASSRTLRRARRLKNRSVEQ